ncbi:hypothetical protein Sbs19_29470 [Sphingobium sp. BS19]|nr:hypothetical protein Sbs19_29470 [Sphingobium sp. BS19]
MGAAVIPWSFAAGSTSANDFTGGSYPTGGNVNLADGASSGTFSVSVNGDATVESDEAFTVSISAPSGYAAGASMSATGTILNDDSTPTPAPFLSLSSAVTQAEGNSGTTGFSWTLTLERDGSTASFPYNWAITGGGANPANAADFGGTFPSGSGTFAPGETSKTIIVLVTGDTAEEPNDTFTLTVTAAGLNTVTSTGTITNDDTSAVALVITGAPSPAVSDTAYRYAPEVTGGSGTKTFAFTGATAPSALGGSFNAATGEITGPFNAVGTVAGTITVTDTSGSASQSVSIPVAASPARVANLMMALDSAELAVTLPRGPVRTWPSAFGAALAASMVTLDRAPQMGLRSINRLRVANLDAGTSPLTVSIPHASGYTLFLLIDWDSYSTARNLFNGANGALGARISATGTVQVLRVGGATLQNGITPINRVGPNLITIKAGPWGTSIAINGVADQSNTTDATLTQPITSLGGLTSSFDGGLASFLAYSGNMAPSDVTAVEAFLTNKWKTAPSLASSPMTASDGKILTWANAQPVAWAA